MSINYRGFALLEVLITMVIMAVTMLGIASLLLNAHRTSSSNYLKQQYMQSMYNIIDKMRANKAAVIAGNYNVSSISSGAPNLPPQPSANCDISSCTATQLAAYDTWYWLTQDIGLLPKGSGAITTQTVGNNTVVTVTIQIDDSPAQVLFGANGQAGGNSGQLTDSIKTSL